MGDVDTDINIRLAAAEEYERVRASYQAWGYTGGVLASDVIFTARRGDELIGIVRRTVERGHLMLRGMHIAPSWQNRGVGTMLLGAFVGRLPPGACHCVPYSYLERFYGQIDFVKIPEAEAPPHLVERLAHYRLQGRDMIIMRRP